MNRTILRIAALSAALATQQVPAAPQSVPHEVEGVEVTVVEARRGEGDIVTVKWTLENKTDKRVQVTKERAGWYDPYRVTGDAYFLDARNRKKHTVIRDDKRVPLAAKYGKENNFTFIEPKRKVALWAKFNAPPADVTKVELHLPGATAPLEGVTLVP
jgi:hypothetical protein